MPTADPHIARIQARHQAVADAIAAEEQAIRDAADAGVPPTSIAHDGLGTQSKGRVYAILGRSADGLAPARPTPTPTVYLRGAGCDDATWARVERAMWARGWNTVRDRRTAWHLARGGTPVALADFSTDVEVDGHRAVQVSRVRARYETTSSADTLSSCLPAVTIDSLVQAVPAARAWLLTVVTVEQQEFDLQIVSGGLRGWPRQDTPTGPVLDEQVLARWVAEVVEHRG